jgi:hypothetical protein
MMLHLKDPGMDQFRFEQFLGQIEVSDEYGWRLVEVWVEVFPSQLEYSVEDVCPATIVLYAYDEDGGDVPCNISVKLALAGLIKEDE